MLIFSGEIPGFFYNLAMFMIFHFCFQH